MNNVIQFPKKKVDENVNDAFMTFLSTIEGIDDIIDMSDTESIEKVAEAIKNTLEKA